MGQDRGRNIRAHGSGVGPRLRAGAAVSLLLADPHDATAWDPINLSATQDV